MTEENLDHNPFAALFPSVADAQQFAVNYKAQLGIQDAGQCSTRLQELLLGFRRFPGYRCSEVPRKLLFSMSIDFLLKSTIHVSIDQSQLSSDHQRECMFVSRSGVVADHSQRTQTATAPEGETKADHPTNTTSDLGLLAQEKLSHSNIIERIFLITLDKGSFVV